MRVEKRKSALKTVAFLMVIAAFPLRANADTGQALPLARPDLPWDQRSYEDRLYNGRYEDRHTFKHGKPYVLDPWTWGYTKEFAEQFHMPEKWIEPGLKGALAVAFRMTSMGANTECGLGGKEDNCWQPLNCQLDIYYDNRIALSWNYPEIMRDNLMQGLHSGQYLHDPSFRSRGVGRNFYGRWDSRDEAKEKPVGVGIGIGVLKYGKYIPGISALALFDREYQPGVGLISWIGGGVCPRYAGSEQVFMELPNGEGDHSKAQVKSYHRIDLPVSFLQRAKQAYELQKKPQDDAIKQLIKDFQGSKAASAN